MKKTVFLLGILTSLNFVNAQSTTNEPAIEVGNQLIISKPINSKHINFPKKNIIVKRGVIANFQQLRGVKVEVTAVEKVKENTLITLKREDKKPFFRFYKSVTANGEKAIEAGELTMP
ncbi:hypothetical protein KO500_03980 [Cellulophaga baltica]|uniref:hypothetical protein n=1 Tax=Cellulophaga TaxID=104264 RepID=UPI001C072C92|nr:MULTISPECIES: hypothetical protein [Cellulophaga]MBU2995573.1 hypothetical protein [Cellulophaga baltica]MDO6766967.1 hypothetical protein [Cellulophaga sp. 1_MG-2023]